MSARCACFASTRTRFLIGMRPESPEPIARSCFRLHLVLSLNFIEVRVFFPPEEFFSRKISCVSARILYAQLDVCVNLLKL